MNFNDWEALINEDPDDAARRAARTLDEDPENALALFVIATVYSRAERFGISANIFTRITQIKPERAEPWNNLGMCYSGMGDNAKAQAAFKHAWSLAKTATFAANVGMSYHSEKDHANAMKWCNRALELDPNCRSAKATLGMTHLAQGNWEKGWKYNAASIGGKFRKNIQYLEEPMWEGQKGQTVVFWGEQGLGDEIMYASCIPDAQRECKEVILECDKRLTNLYKRSFPGVHVYGTRGQQVEWPDKHKIDARLAVGQLPEFYRPSPASCPGTPYLVADPERRVQWKALLDSFGKKKIGIAWTGGSKYNKPSARAMGLEAFREIIESIDATWVSLQYKDPSEEIAASGLPVHHWKRACETDDYDDTAALVAELDLVISVPTTIVHTAGALGVETHCLTHPDADWSFRCGFPWYKSVKLFWKQDETWSKCASRYLERLHRLRPPPAVGVQRTSALDSSTRKQAGIHHSADPAAVAHQAQGLDRFHLQPISRAVVEQFRGPLAVS